MPPLAEGEFGPEHVGLSTGDATINREASILCCTAEVLSNIALRDGADASFDHVVMDEFHYYADRDRGVAWQVPRCASATVKRPERRWIRSPTAKPRLSLRNRNRFTFRSS